MRILFEFECKDHGKFEALVEQSYKQAICPVCGIYAPKIISTPRISLDGTDPAFPDAYDQWEKKRAAKQKIEERQIAEHGSIT